MTACVPPVAAETVQQEIDQAEQFNQQAMELYQQGKYQEALPLLQRALTICEKVLGPEHDDTAISLSNLAMLHYNLGQYDKALLLNQRALEIREKVLGPEHSDTIDSLQIQASVYQALGQYDDALRLHQRALAIKEKILGPEHAYNVSSLNGLAALYLKFDQYDKALPLLQRALVIREKSLGPEHADTIATLTYLARLYRMIGQNDKALLLYQRLLAVNEKKFGSEHEKTVNSINELADVSRTMGLYEDALPLLQRSLEINEKTFGLEHGRTAYSINSLAVLYQTIGLYGKALPLMQRSLEINESVKSSDHPSTAVAINNLAVLYRSMGKNDQALALFQRALDISERALGADHAFTAACLNNLGSQYKTQGQNEKALQFYQRALAIQEKTLGKEHPEIAATTNNIALLYEDTGQYEEALPLLQRALEINETNLGQEHESVAINLSNLAGLYDATGKHWQALMFYQRAYSISRLAGVPEVHIETQANLGDYYAGQGAAPAAIFYLKGAVNTMQSIRAESRGLDRDLQHSLLLKNQDIYNQLVDLLVEQGRLAEAQQVIAMLKEEEYFDLIRRDSRSDNRRTHIRFNDGEQPFVTQIEKLGKEGAALVEQLNKLDKQSKLGLTPEQELERKKIRAMLDKKEQQTIAVLNQIPRKLVSSQKARRIKSGIEDQHQSAALLKSLGHGPALLSYVISDQRINIILATPKMQIARQVEIPRKELNRKISEFRRALQNPERDPRPLAQELYRLLILPVQDDLKNADAKTLMFSLDGSLRYLPMATLHDGTAYLAERYPMAIYTEVAKDRLGEKPGRQLRAAGFGITRKIGEFAPLPAVRQEMSGIINAESSPARGGVLPGDIYLDEAFTEARLHGAVGQGYPVMHIASHFVFIPGTEAQSFLLLGDGKQLSLAELRIAGWKFSGVDMMTLSACETALGGGQDEKGREIEGFGVLAQRQGAKAVLATLWSVADQSTATFMQEFYRLRKDGHLTKAEALRKTQIAFISGAHKSPQSIKSAPAGNPSGTNNAPNFTPDPAKPYAHPYYWAPFILMGNWL